MEIKRRVLAKNRVSGKDFSHPTVLSLSLCHFHSFLPQAPLSASSSALPTLLPIRVGALALVWCLSIRPPWIGKRPGLFPWFQGQGPIADEDVHMSQLLRHQRCWRLWVDPSVLRDARSRIQLENKLARVTNPARAIDRYVNCCCPACRTDSSLR